MPFSFDEPDKLPRIVPSHIQCMQHGGRHAVTATRILTHEDGTRHVHAFATCGGRGLPEHEFGVYLRPAE